MVKEAALRQHHLPTEDTSWEGILREGGSMWRLGESMEADGGRNMNCSVGSRPRGALQSLKVVRERMGISNSSKCRCLAGTQIGPRRANEKVEELSSSLQSEKEGFWGGLGEGAGAHLWCFRQTK